MPNKSKYRIVNWNEYNAALKQRGSPTFWIGNDVDQSWYANSDIPHKQGRPIQYSDSCIQYMLTLRQVYRLPLRQLTGFVESLFTVMGKNLRVPDFSCLSRRSTTLQRFPKLPSDNEPVHIVIDSTGLKVFGEKEWLETKHGKQYQRKVWRKLHINIDQEGFILSNQLTDHKTDDRSCVSSLVAPVIKPSIKLLLADSGYDSHNIYQELNGKGIRILIPPPINAGISKEINPTSRDQTVSYIKTKGYWAWFRKNDFGRRARVENTFYRIKTIFGRKLLSRSMGNQQVESDMICSLLNKITILGMPKTVKIV